MRVEILQGPTHGGDVWTLDKAAATNFFKGELASFESSAAVHMNAVGEDATFCGIVAMDARDSETEVTLFKKCQIEIDAASAAYTPNQTLKYSAGDSGTDYSLTDGGDANDIARCAKEYPAGTTRIRVNIDIDKLAKFPEAFAA